MPYRKTVLAPGEIYHVFNRGVARLPIFSGIRDFIRFLDLTKYYRYSNTPTSFSNLNNLSIDDRNQILEDLREKNFLHVKILSFCLMNNHYHFLLQQLTEHGTRKFISNLQNGYAKYFNIKTKRTGPLLQPMFKAERIETNEQLLHVSRYIHLNPSTEYLVKIINLKSYQWSSLSCYLENKSLNYSFIDTSIILGLITRRKYSEFVYDQAEYQRELGKIKHLILE